MTPVGDSQMPLKKLLEYIISRELKHFPAERIDSVVYSFPETHRYM